MPVLNSVCFSRKYCASIVLAVLVATLPACGGGSSSGNNSSADRPVITTQPANVTANEGQTITFSVNVQSASAPTYQWLKNGEEIPGATGASYATTATLHDSNAVFSVRISSTAGSVVSDAAILMVNRVSGIIQMLNGRPIDGALIGVDAKGASYVRNGTTIIKLGPDGEPLPYGNGTLGVVIPATYRCTYAPEPASIVTADGTVYASTFSTAPYSINNCNISPGGAIHKIDPTGQKIAVIKPADDILFAPSRLTQSNDGTVYFIDAVGPKVRKLTTEGRIIDITTLYQWGQIDDRTSYALGNPSIPYITSDNADGLFLADIRTILKLDSTGKQTVLAARDSNTPVDGSFDQSSFYRILDLQWHPSTATLIALDGSPALILRQIDPSGKKVKTIAGQATSTATNIEVGPLPGVLGQSSRENADHSALVGADGEIYLKIKGKVFKVNP
ncbi:MAG: immunoglobulin domain-containing protein [Acidovorax sp.]|nr:immunoglobulin domain-containing protein [Acidovorax sp.]